jgi:hypothetical protein
VSITVDRTGTGSAVVSGIFLGGPLVPGTLGNWVSAYGGDGYGLGGYNAPSGDLVNLPNSSVTLLQGLRYVNVGAGETGRHHRQTPATPARISGLDGRAARDAAPPRHRHRRQRPPQPHLQRQHTYSDAGANSNSSSTRRRRQLQQHNAADRHAGPDAQPDTGTDSDATPTVPPTPTPTLAPTPNSTTPPSVPGQPVLPAAGAGQVSLSGTTRLMAVSDHQLQDLPVDQHRVFDNGRSRQRLHHRPHQRTTLVQGGGQRGWRGRALGQPVTVPSVPRFFTAAQSFYRGQPIGRRPSTAVARSPLRDLPQHDQRNRGVDQDRCVVTA